MSGRRFSEAEQDRIRRHIGGDFYRMTPSAQAVAWWRAAAELGISSEAVRPCPVPCHPRCARHAAVTA